MISLAKGAKREIKDYMLTRFACYLIAQNGDPKKEDIANEIRQAMVELVKIARYYQVEEELEASIQTSLERSKAEGLID